MRKISQKLPIFMAFRLYSTLVQLASVLCSFVLVRDDFGPPKNMEIKYQSFRETLRDKINSAEKIAREFKGTNLTIWSQDM